MSWDNRLGGDGGASHPTQSLHLRSAMHDTSGPSKLSHLSADGWEELKETLIDLYENKGWKAQQINQWMRDAGHLTTPKMVMNHLNKWGIRRYQSSKDKEALCKQLLEDSARGRQILLGDVKQLKKLQRYCKEKPEQTESDKKLLSLLQELENESARYSDSSTCDAPAENEDSSTDVDQWCMVDAMNQDLVFPQASRFLGSAITGEIAEQGGVGLVLDSLTNAGPSRLVPYIPDPIIRQPGHFGSKFMAMEKLLHLSQQYYHVKLQEHFLLHLQGLNMSTQESDSTLTSDSLTHNTSYSRLFWRKVKNGIYYLKMGSEHLARQEITEAFPMIPLLCEKHPFTLLQEIHATLSPMATRIRPALRNDILRAFRQSAVAKLGPNHQFSEICEMLCAEEGSDELSTTALQAMLDETKQVLSPDQQELFDLQRAIIRLYRRSRDFAKAEEMIRSLIASQEALHGKNHVSSRLALSEYVYILNDQNRHEEALLVAEDVVQRGQRDQGRLFPDERSVYAMEDVAEVCVKLGRINASIDWLRRASRAALGVWGNQTATVHVMEKLENMHEKRYKQAVAIHMP